MNHWRQGYSLVEAIMVVSLLGIVALIALPRFSYSTIERSSARVIAQKLATDLRLTRSLAISNAATEPDGYQLVFIREGSSLCGYAIRRIGDGQTEATIRTDKAVGIRCESGETVAFGPLGNVKNGKSFALEITGGDGSIRIEVIPQTGSIKQIEAGTPP